MADPDLVANVARILQETGLDPGSLRIEVTESSIMENQDLTSATLRRLQDLGISLEIDDFGTGYSSLSRLHEYPFSTVKIDRSFIKDLETETESLHLVKTILRLADGLGLSVVAEGIETPEQLARLASLGCGYGQGYYFSRPADGQRSRRSSRRPPRNTPASDSENAQPGCAGSSAELAPCGVVRVSLMGPAIRGGRRRNHRRGQRLGLIRIGRCGLQALQQGLDGNRAGRRGRGAVLGRDRPDPREYSGP